MKTMIIISSFLGIMVAFAAKKVPADDCICTMEYKPVCASDKKTYPNKCMFNCMNKDNCTKIVHEGSCKADDCICTKEYKPVCASNGKTYPNKCMFNCMNKDNSTKIVHEGSCRDYFGFLLCDIKCPTNVQSVCGSDGKQYKSDCSVGCHRKFLGRKDLCVKNQGECKK